MTWTPSHIAQIRFLWSEGLTGNEIAAIMGLTRNQVLGKAQRLGLAERPSPIHREPRPTPNARKLIDLTDSHCRYPLGGQYEPARWFCGKPVAGLGEPYCHHCRALAWEKPKRKPVPTTWAGEQMRAMG